jgi:hypothetical protein
VFAMIRSARKVFVVVEATGGRRADKIAVREFLCLNVVVDQGCCQQSVIEEAEQRRPTHSTSKHLPFQLDNHTRIVLFLLVIKLVETQKPEDCDESYDMNRHRLFSVVCPFGILACA